MRKEIDKISQASKEDGDTPTTVEKGKGEDGRVIYELYADPKNQGDMTTDQVERLNRIETFLGSNTSGASDIVSPDHNNLSVLERLKIAENKLKNVDEKVLDNAAARAKVIR